MLLDFSAFACDQIQVSFLVVSQRDHSEFSPALSLCLDGGEMKTVCLSDIIVGLVQFNDPVERVCMLGNTTSKSYKATDIAALGNV